MVDRIAIIPARGGSKRLPRKNILPLKGKPLLGYVIETALASKLFDKVIVSTEDTEIKEIASEYDALIHHRNPSLAKDDSSVNDVCYSIFSEYSWINSNTQFCIIYSTAVLLTSETLNSSMNEFNSTCDYLMGVSTYNFPPVQALKCNANNYLSYQWPEYSGKRSQLYPELVVSNGTFYWGRVGMFLEEGTIYGERMKGFLVDEEEVCDLDYPQDFNELEEKFDMKNIK